MATTLIKEPLLSLFEKVAADISFAYPLNNIINLTLFFRELNKPENHSVKQNFYTNLWLNHTDKLNKDYFFYGTEEGDRVAYSTVITNLFDITITDIDTIATKKESPIIHLDNFLEKIIKQAGQKTLDDLAVIFSRQFKEPYKGFLEQPFVAAFINSFSNKWSSHSLFNKNISQPEYQKLLSSLLESKDFIATLQKNIVSIKKMKNHSGILFLYTNLIDLLKEKETLTPLEQTLFDSLENIPMLFYQQHDANVQHVNNFEDRLYDSFLTLKNNSIITHLSTQTTPLFNKEMFTIQELFVSTMLLTHSHTEQWDTFLTGKRMSIYCPLSLDISNKAEEFFTFLIENPEYLKTIEKHSFYVFNNEKECFAQTTFKEFVSYLLRNVPINKQQVITAELFSLLEKHSFLNKLTNTEHLFKRNLMIKDNPHGLS